MFLRTLQSRWSRPHLYAPHWQTLLLATRVISDSPFLMPQFQTFPFTSALFFQCNFLSPLLLSPQSSPLLLAQSPAPFSFTPVSPPPSLPPLSLLIICSLAQASQHSSSSIFLRLIFLIEITSRGLGPSHSLFVLLLSTPDPGLQRVTLSASPPVSSPVLPHPLVSSVVQHQTLLVSQSVSGGQLIMIQSFQHVGVDPPLVMGRVTLDWVRFIVALV